ncbi:hypothetical protein BJ508DRAFT_323718 [Ascobolus immersus RN42]|uniref:F-box domain-containing protein n=1 Tax=Ascobolus immersus RN42 TaxID=1160509 RepID=A0A3N4IE79_ASCIM|nr:hypothetical protein BJ508DRAFT_323718 [Ascobolus immersus RN42]
MGRGKDRGLNRSLPAAGFLSCSRTFLWKLEMLQTDEPEDNAAPSLENQKFENRLQPDYPATLATIIHRFHADRDPQTVRTPSFSPCTPSSSPSPTPSDSTRTFEFLHLPQVLRIRVYTQCTVFTLLNLSQTCAKLRREVNACPEVVRRAYGYTRFPWKGWRGSGGVLWIGNVMKVERGEVEGLEGMVERGRRGRGGGKKEGGKEEGG